jgi:predicted permease
MLIEGRAGSDNQFRSEGGGVSAGGDANSINSNVVSQKYFQTMGISFARGRDFNSQDTADRPKVIIVNEAFVRRHVPNEEVLGRRVSFNGPAGPWQEIVGVVRDSKYLAIGESPTPVAYLPLQQNHETGMTLHVRAGNPSSIAAGIRSEVQSMEKNLPVGNPMPVSESISNSLYAARMGAALLGIFGLLALLLAAVGLYGVMSFSVSRRTRELGIRMALGAQAADVFRLVLRQGLMLVLPGIALGLILAAMVTTRLLTSFLYGISATDAVTFASIPVILAVVAMVACYLPARRATKVDPLVALRYE